METVDVNELRYLRTLAEYFHLSQSDLIDEWNCFRNYLRKRA